MNAPERAEAQSGDNGYGRAGPHAPGGDSNNQLAREPSSYGGEAVPTPGGLEGRTPNPPSADTAASYDGIAVDGQAEVCQNGQSRGEPAANPGEARETFPPFGDATVPADVLKNEHGAVLDTLPTVAKKINALFDKAAKADEKAETYRISAGQELANARARVSVLLVHRSSRSTLLAQYGDERKKPYSLITKSRWPAVCTTTQKCTYM
jgi:hypothetical protein